MNVCDKFKGVGCFCGVAYYENPERSVFYRKGHALKAYFEALPLVPYEGKPLYPSGVRAEIPGVSIHYMDGISFDAGYFDSIDAELSDFIRKNPIHSYRSSLPSEHTIAGNMYTHSMPNYERICAEGFDSYIPRIEKIKDIDMRDGLLELLEGIRIYARRCVDYLESVGAEKRLIEALRRIPMQRCETLYEAIVCWNFVLYLDGCDNLGCVANGLMPYYRGEGVGELIGNLYDNIDENGGYSMSLGTDDYNPLVLECIKALEGKRRPMTELFIDEDTPDEVWNAAIDVIKKGGGQPAFYGKKTLLGGLRRRFPEISDDDIKRFCGGGCTESMLAGLSNVGSLDAGINLALILERSIHKNLVFCESFEDFYRIFIEDTRAACDEVTREIYNSQKARSLVNPLPMRTLLVDDCIDKGVDFNSGGARYCWSIVSFAGMVNVIDSMAFIREYVYEKRRYSADELCGLLSANDEEFLAFARDNKNAFGNGCEATNELARRLSTDVFSLLDGRKTYYGLGFIPAAIMFSNAAWSGKRIGATPDGRPAFSPLCESLAANHGKDRHGPTVMLESVTSLALDLALGVPVVNLTVNPSFDSSVLKGLIKGYVASGGVQLQLTCTSKAELLAAFENPDEHKNLIVRVGGYSEYFHRLERDLQESIVKRCVHL